MANNLGLTEVTLAQLTDSTHAINANGTWDRVRVARVTDHVTNTGAETDDPELMAIFECKAKGHPWMRTGTHLASKRFVQQSTPVAVPTDAEVLFPNWDYTEFN